jgi:thiamine pyrophosphate-dependent acetolactate synthase large subunit-like protein
MASVANPAGTPAALPSGSVVVLAGPGVLAAGALAGLRTLAAAHDLGVANTWGAKGVFNWDSPHHLGTCGLQARDFELLGWSEADAILATGIDDAESPRERFALAPVIDIDVHDLASLGAAAPPSNDVGSPTRPPLVNDLYPRLAAVAQPGFVDDKVPLHPARAVADLGAVLPPGGLVAADPGVAGLWVARTFPTPALAPGESRRVVVPAVREAGVAARLAIAAARSGRPAIAVTTGPIDDATGSACAAAAEEGLDLVLVVWGSRGRLGGADEYRLLIAEALGTPGVTTLEVPVALDDTRLLVEAAGDVVAWGGLG